MSAKLDESMVFVAVNERLDPGHGEASVWRKVDFEERNWYEVMESPSDLSLENHDQDVDECPKPPGGSFKTSCFGNSNDRVPLAFFISDPLLRRDPPFVRFVYSNKLEKKSTSFLYRIQHPHVSDRFSGRNKGVCAHQRLFHTRISSWLDDAARCRVAAARAHL